MIPTQTNSNQAAPETVWALLQEVGEGLKELRDSQKETDRILTEKFQETDRLFKETREEQKETDRQIEKTAREIEKTERVLKDMFRKTDRRIEKISKNLGGLGNSMGELIETLIAARLWEKFEGYPYNLKRAYHRVFIYNDDNVLLTDVDILLSDSEWVMAVEVKRKPDKEDVNHHLERMERIRKYPPAEAKGKKLLGAIAGGAVDIDIHKYAHNAGFFVFELKGESVSLVPQPEGFVPREW